MLNGYVALPKPDSEIKNGSNNPVSGDAVYDYVDSKIPSPLNSVYIDNVVNGVGSWKVSNSASFRFGNVIHVHIYIRSLNDIYLSDTATIHIGTLINLPSIPLIIPITFMPDYNPVSPPIPESRIGFVDTDSKIYLPIYGETTIPINTFLRAGFVYVSPP
jgi:hypothetical protein